MIGRRAQRARLIGRRANVKDEEKNQDKRESEKETKERQKEQGQKMRS